MSYHLPGLDRITWWFLAAVGCCAAVYVSAGWSPSSYGIVLDQLGAAESGPVAGVSREVRSDEWSLATPYIQATVRNRFQRFNETSFYREDLRNFQALPLEDWSLVFKPQFWAFFVLPPAFAFSLYHALWMAAFLAGYQLWFRHLGVASWMAAAAAVMIFFAGFTQFWWTTYGPSLAGLPWLLLLVERPMVWWKKALLCAWAFPTVILAHVYPALLITLAWGGLILVLATRASLLRSYKDLGAIAVGGMCAAAVVYFYYADVIPVMRNALYPSRRTLPAGTVGLVTVLSQIFPFFHFAVGDYQNLDTQNLCEASAVGSFLPLLTFCLMRHRDFWNRTGVRNAVLVLLAGFTAITLWEIAPLPAFIGRILLWNTGSAERWMFVSGLLLIVACLLIWRDELVSFNPSEILVFLLLGPVASIAFKLAWLSHKGIPEEVRLSNVIDEIVLGGLVLVAGLIACYAPVRVRAPLLVIPLALVNLYAFGRFNPLQPAGPLFHPPDTAAIRELHKQAEESPGGVLGIPRVLQGPTYGAALNGLGFRSLDHVLIAPELSFFRDYFPAMDTARFNEIFNRYARINASSKLVPELMFIDVIDVPAEAFVPVQNLRRAEVIAPRRDACSPAPAGGVENVATTEGELQIEGWARWTSETDQQGVRVFTARRIRAEISTVRRADIAERLGNYGFVKAGFRLRLSATDHQPLVPKDVSLRAFGTSGGEHSLACCGCP